MAGSFQTAIIKTHSGRSLNELLSLVEESGETAMCRQGVVNTRQSGVFAARFTRLFCSNVGGSVSLRPAHQVLVRHVGNVLARFMSGGGGRAELCFLIRSFSGTPRQADYGVLLTRTNCLSVRSEQILLWVSPCWIVRKKSTSLQCCPVVCVMSLHQAAKWSYMVSMKCLEKTNR